MAEDVAWKFVNENNIDMVAINPTLVVGPPLQAEINESLDPILSLINGNFYLLVKLCCVSFLLSVLPTFALHDVFQLNCFFFVPSE